MGEQKRDSTWCCGGVGSYATLSFFERFLNAFPAEKDWERPRILIDNYSTLPSRVRAILYNENVEELESRLLQSVDNLLKAGATDVVLACHTAHYFLPKIKDSIGTDGNKVLSLIDLAKEKCVSLGIGEVRLLASEGTIQAGIYEKVFETEENKIPVTAPDEMALKDIRKLIEAVKQNKITENELRNFKTMLEARDTPVILGCSELPVLMQECIEAGIEIRNQIIDPLQSVIDVMLDKYNKIK